MKKTLFGVVFIALLIGLGGGYAFGYFAYQSQLQNLQIGLNDVGDELNSLSNDFDNLRGTLETEFPDLWNQMNSFQIQLSILDSRGHAITLCGMELMGTEPDWTYLTVMSGSADAFPASVIVPANHSLKLWALGIMAPTETPANATLRLIDVDTYAVVKTMTTGAVCEIYDPPAEYAGSAQVALQGLAGAVEYVAGYMIVSIEETM